MEGSLSVSQLEHHIKEWSKQNEDRDIVYHVSYSTESIILVN